MACLRRLLSGFVPFFVSFWLLPSAARAETITVGLEGEADFREIQPALDAARDGDTVLVKAGEYVINEPITFKGKAIAVKSQAGAEATSIRMSETPADPERASVVVFEKGERNTSVLEGFTLTGGEGTSWTSPFVGTHPTGGGIFCNGSSPTVKSCVIAGNDPVACLYGAAPSFADCTIRGDGSGVFCFESNPTFMACQVIENFWFGVLVAFSSPVFTDCRITQNAPQGIRIWGSSSIIPGGSSSPRFSRCEISDNLGPGVHMESYEGIPRFVDCVISGNRGPGIECDNGGSFTNCTIVRNTRADGAGGVFCSGPTTFTSCTIAGNATRGLWVYSGPVTLVNCIVWGNSCKSIEGRPGYTLNASYSCIEGPSALPGAGNTNQDPLFLGWGAQREVYVDGASPEPGDGTEARPFSSLSRALEFDYSLAKGSPCLGTGKGGSNMGAPADTCEAPGETSRLVHLARGAYPIEGWTLSHHVSLEGQGEEETAIEGTIWGLRTGSTLSRLTVTKGVRSGIIVSQFESPDISFCRISGNRNGGVEDDVEGWSFGSASGGGVVCLHDSSPRFSHCTISRNFAENTGGGVACFVRASPSFHNCTIEKNALSTVYGMGGGGAWFRAESTATFTNSRIVENLGGGLHFWETSSPTLTNCTIAGNLATHLTSPDSWGAYCEDNSTPTFVNCIIGGNQGASLKVIEGAQPVVMFTCVEGEPAWPGEGNLSADPLLVKIGAWSGDSGTPEDPTDDEWIDGDYHLEAVSPAIDAGTPAGAPESDLDGNPRPCGNGFDLGAYERCEGARFQRGDGSGDGALNLTDPVFVLGHLFLGGDPPGCLDAADSNDDGNLDISDAIYSLNHLFLDGPAPASPFPECGADSSADDLDCLKSPACP